MIDFLHAYYPDPILFSIGPIVIYWYGFFIVCGVVAAILIATKLGKFHGVKKDDILDLTFLLIVGGIIGARLYHVILEWSYYSEHLLNMFKVWNGGLAIHGAVIAGVFIIWFFSKKKQINFWLLTSLIVPGLILAQALGRWGNYFNQELFGKPTVFPWGIPIDIMNRPYEFVSSEFFHPTFFYESIGNFFIFLILISVHFLVIRKKLFNNAFFVITAIYLMLYSILRFSLEFIRIDATPEIWSLRLPQIASIIIVLLTFGLIIYKIRKDKKLA